MPPRSYLPGAVRTQRSAARSARSHIMRQYQEPWKATPIRTATAIAPAPAAATASPTPAVPSPSPSPSPSPNASISPSVSSSASSASSAASSSSTCSSDLAAIIARTPNTAGRYELEDDDFRPPKTASARPGVGRGRQTSVVASAGGSVAGRGGASSFVARSKTKKKLTYIARTLTPRVRAPTPAYVAPPSRPVPEPKPRPKPKPVPTQTQSSPLFLPSPSVSPSSAQCAGGGSGSGSADEVEPIEDRVSLSTASDATLGSVEPARTGSPGASLLPTYEGHAGSKTPDRPPVGHAAKQFWLTGDGQTNGTDMATMSQPMTPIATRATDVVALDGPLPRPTSTMDVVRDSPPSPTSPSPFSVDSGSPLGNGLSRDTARAPAGPSTCSGYAFSRPHAFHPLPLNYLVAPEESSDSRSPTLYDAGIGGSPNTSAEERALESIVTARAPSLVGESSWDQMPRPSQAQQIWDWSPIEHGTSLWATYPASAPSPAHPLASPTWAPASPSPPSGALADSPYTRFPPPPPPSSTTVWNPYAAVEQSTIPAQLDCSRGLAPYSPIWQPASPCDISNGGATGDEVGHARQPLHSSAGRLSELGVGARAADETSDTDARCKELAYSIKSLAQDIRDRVAMMERAADELLLELK